MNKEKYIQIAIEGAVLILIIGIIFAFNACSRKTPPQMTLSDTGSENESSVSEDPEEDTDDSEPEEEDAPGENDSDSDHSPADAENDISEKERAQLIEADALKDDFVSTVNWLEADTSRQILLDLSATVRYDGRASKYIPSDDYRQIDREIASGADKLTRSDVTNTGNGSAMTADVWRDSRNSIVKIRLTEYGSGGRTVSEWYFRDRDIIYESRCTDDLYGTGQHLSTLSMTSSVEAEMLKTGYLAYDALKQVPGYARVYGYVSDEFGGILSGVQAKIRSSFHEYDKEAVTNGDGYYEFYVPVNTDDYYNISFTYGDWQPGTVNDIAVTPGITNFSCGRLYMAPHGQNIHDADLYLMNINKKSPVELSDGEYAVKLEFETAYAALKPYVLSVADGSMASSPVIKFPSGEGDRKYYVADIRNGGSNNMSYDMSVCNACVTVYDKNGIVASFLAPPAHAGVVWEVFEVKDGKILPVNNYYFDTPSDVAGMFF